MTQIVEFNTQELQLIEKSKADQIKATFEPMSKMLSELEGRYKDLMSISVDEITPDLIKEYKRLRLDYSKVRIDTGKAKDKAKEYLKLEDKAIMGLHNVVVWATKENEDKLKERENHFENLEKQRIADLQKERELLVGKFIEDADKVDLGNMADDVFEYFLGTKEKTFTDRIEAERLAEEQRQEAIRKEAEEKEALRIENEKLKQEAEAKEKLRLEELAEAKRIQDKKDAEAKAIRDEEIRIQAEKDAKIKADLAEAKRIQDEKDLAAKKEQARVEAELAKAKQEAEDAKLKAEKIESDRIESERLAKQAELAKGDADKVNDLIEALELLKTKFTFESDSNKKMYSQVGDLLTKVINHIVK